MTKKNVTSRQKRVKKPYYYYYYYYYYYHYYHYYHSQFFVVFWPCCLLAYLHTTVCVGLSCSTHQVGLPCFFLSILVYTVSLHARPLVLMVWMISVCLLDPLITSQPGLSPIISC